MASSRSRTDGGRAAQAAADEAQARPRTFSLGGLELALPTKWKRFRFLRRLNSGDLWGALEAVFDAGQLDEIEALDIDEEEFQAVLERLGETLIGAGGGNSPPSPPS